MTFLTLKMISIGFDNVAIEPGVLKNQCFDAEFRSLAHLELDFWQKLPKFANLTLKSDLLTFRMTFDVVKNVTIELADPQNPLIHPDIRVRCEIPGVLSGTPVHTWDPTSNPVYEEFPVLL